MLVPDKVMYPVSDICHAEITLDPKGERLVFFAGAIRPVPPNEKRACTQEAMDLDYVTQDF
jgi:hypothetical protein